jgi:FHS family L-fucose permease-like MFS transporter
LIQKRHYLLVLLSAFGSFMFVPAATMESFPFFLTALFTVGLGFSIQQIVANPLAIKIAPILVHRLTLAGINSFELLLVLFY